MEYIAFMGAILHTEIDYVETTLQEYDIGLYLIALETAPQTHKETKGQHLHFLVQMNDKDYHRFSKRIFIDKYKLRGKAEKDKPRQYGRVKKIEDLKRMGAYTVKDGNIRTNMEQTQLAEYLAISFNITEKKEFKDELYSHIVNTVKPQETKWGTYEEPTYEQIGVGIINFYQTYKIKYPLSRTQLDNHIRYFELHHTKKTPQEIFDSYFPNK